MIYGDLVKVWALALVVTLAQVEAMLKIALLAITIAYTGWKFYSDYRAKKNGTNK